MSALRLNDLYERHIKPLSLAERIRLIALTADDLVQGTTSAAEPPKRSILELHGLGSELWRGLDAQEHINQLRDEWDHRP